MKFRRKTDELVAGYLKDGERPEEVLTEIVKYYGKLRKFEKEGYKIVAYKEKASLYEIKEIN
jgi:hypothetical protein